MEKTLQMLNSLERDGIISRYAIGGAIAAIFYMEPFLTYDLDIFVAVPQSADSILDLTGVYGELRARGCRVEGEYIHIEGLPVQILPAYNTLIEEALVQAQDIVYESIPARVVRAEHLMAIMLQTGRDKDRQRLSAFSRQAGWHQEILDDILKRHNLKSRWKEWTE